MKLHGALKMNQVTTQHHPAACHAQPLFASSWVALYVILRDNLARGGAWNAPTDDSPKAGDMGHMH
jgi:hypothetical protein